MLTRCCLTNIATSDGKEVARLAFSLETLVSRGQRLLKSEYWSVEMLPFLNSVLADSSPLVEKSNRVLAVLMLLGALLFFALVFFFLSFLCSG